MKNNVFLKDLLLDEHYIMNHILHYLMNTISHHKKILSL